MVARLAKLVEKIRLIKSLSSSEKTNWPKNVVYAPSICCSFLVCCQQATLPILARNLPPFLFRLFCNCHWFVLVLFRRHVRHDRSLFGSRPKIYPKMKKKTTTKKKIRNWLSFFVDAADCHCVLWAVCVKSLFNDDDSINTNRERPERKRKKPFPYWDFTRFQHGHHHNRHSGCGMMSAGIFSIVDEKPPHPHAISVFIFCFSLLSSPSSRLCFFFFFFTFYAS